MYANPFPFFLRQTTLTLHLHLGGSTNGDSVMFMPGSLVSAILRGSSRPATRQFCCLSAKIAFLPHGVTLGGRKGVDADMDVTEIGGGLSPHNPNASNLEPNTVKAYLLFCNLTLI